MSLSPPSTLPLIPELLRLICEQSNKSTLASLAATCKAFERPALDVLWFKLEDFYHLVLCIPELFRMEETRDDIKHVLHQGFPLVPGALTRFFGYAEKVRRITFHGTSHQRRRVDISILQALQICCFRRTLLPNLQNLTWLCSEKDNFPYISLFLGPRLSTVLFKFRSHESIYQQMALLPALSEGYPHIKNVTFSLGPSRNISQEDVVRATQLMSSSISKWRNLESLTISCISYDAMREISLLPSLKEFVITRFWNEHVPSIHIQKGGFPVLEILRVCMVTVSDSMPLLELLDMSPLHTLGFWIMEPESSNRNWFRLFTTIKKHCDHSTLTKFTCNEGLAHTPWNEDHYLLFQKLDTIIIQTVHGFYISDSEATRVMSKRWKGLKYLSLSLADGHYPQHISTVTLLDLLPFVENCTELETLSMVVDARDPPAIDDTKRPGNGAYQTALTQIDFGSSPAKFPLRIAAFLSGCFPSLKTIKSSHERSIDMEDSGEVWNQVRDMLSAFTSVRMQERADPIARDIPSLQ